eukprot:TRINITY_DN39742_c0_g1_i1.p1 TRINITY_DN39742_c0_g1~~TRINITY_DN39742_c0_g1_i1.p1  ORF type:complete len:253 (+),score=62.81 TRINITY_DN39742_c0_g1_i1:78-761(+)
MGNVLCRAETEPSLDSPARSRGSRRSSPRRAPLKDRLPQSPSTARSGPPEHIPDASAERVPPFVFAADSSVPRPRFAVTFPPGWSAEAADEDVTGYPRYNVAAPAGSDLPDVVIIAHVLADPSCGLETYGAASEEDTKGELSQFGSVSSAEPQSDPVPGVHQFTLVMHREPDEADEPELSTELRYWSGVRIYDSLYGVALQVAGEGDRFSESVAVALSAAAGIVLEK